MEAARSRLAILCSHISPTSSGVSRTRPNPVSASNCSSSDDEPEEKHKAINECVFCKIVRGESHSLKLYEDDTCMCTLCILDTNPLSRGHSLIIPKAHFPSLDVTPPSVIAAMCSKVPLISSALVKATGSDSFNLLVNNGAAAGQIIFHTHIHIIPRKERDCLWASESLRRYPLKLDQDASKLVNRVREHLSLSLPNDCKAIEGESSSAVRN